MGHCIYISKSMKATPFEEEFILQVEELLQNQKIEHRPKLPHLAFGSVSRLKRHACLKYFCIS